MKKNNQHKLKEWIRLPILKCEKNGGNSSHDIKITLEHFELKGNLETHWTNIKPKHLLLRIK